MEIFHAILPLSAKTSSLYFSRFSFTQFLSQQSYQCFCSKISSGIYPIPAKTTPQFPSRNPLGMSINHVVIFAYFHHSSGFFTHNNFKIWVGRNHWSAFLPREYQHGLWTTPLEIYFRKIFKNTFSNFTRIFWEFLLEIPTWILSLNHTVIPLTII